MAKSSNQKLKVLYLLNIMKELTDENHGLTIMQILEELQKYGIRAERKSIYGDFEALRDFGLTIEKRTGKNVTYHLAERDFELPELKLLVDAVQSSKFITHKKSSTLIKKIEGLTSKYEAQQLQRQVFVANRIKTMNESIYYVIDEIHRAISDDKKISFKYFEWNMKKERQYKRNGKIYMVSPWALTWDDENYYMIAFDDESSIIKHYRVDKMHGLKITDKPRMGAELFENFDMALYSKKTFGMYGGRDEQVTLRCKDKMAGVIIDRFGQDVIMYEVDKEQFEVSARVSVSPLFLTWIMNFGGDIKILSPQSVIDDYVKLAKAALNVYEED
ncbi:MAG: WYL domain-containing protein [Firmicutes bacterium]|jgi:predicted DNA-binding transcriptional regulator YafY|nr:WYL domain-containing protein [Bacillota bacterium]